MNICLLGVDFSNANYGCRALGYSIINILNDISKEKNEKLSVTAIVYDDSVKADFGTELVEMTYICIRPKKLSFYRDYRTSLRKADLIIDFTGGDSFSDIYGSSQFFKASLLKIMAIKSGRPFIMGPQTIGPFYKKSVKKCAKYILKRSAYTFVRDELSFNYAKEIAGIEPILTTDVAFALPYNRSEKGIGEKKRVGINPSGLLWFKHKSFDSDKAVSVEYKEYITKVLEYLCSKDEYEIHLIPHVFTMETTEYIEDYHHENDLQACFHIQKQFPNVIIERNLNTPMDAKSLISTMDVFSGARMHATIAAFSSKVPVIPFSYSRKFEGLFGSLGYNYLIQGTQIDTNSAVKNTIEWIENSIVLQEQVDKCLPIAEERLSFFKDKMREISLRNS